MNRLAIADKEHYSKVYRAFKELLSVHSAFTFTEERKIMTTWGMTVGGYDFPVCKWEQDGEHHFYWVDPYWLSLVEYQENDE